MAREPLHDLSNVTILNIMICMELIKLDVIDLASFASIDLIYLVICYDFKHYDVYGID